MTVSAILEFLTSDSQILNDPTSALYLQYLLSSSLEQISQEPSNLLRTLSTLESEYKQTTTKEYKAFIIAHDHLLNVYSNLVEIEPILGKLNQQIPEISKYATKLSIAHSNGKDIRASHSKITSQLANLEPILEIPSLFDTLIRNNNYEEAMELQLFTQRLPARYPTIPLLGELAKIRTSTHSMLNQLFGMLKGPAKLPLCIRVIGYLRRLNFDDFTLRVLFLNLRYNYVLGLLSLIKESLPQNQLRRWVETQREHLLDIILHYKAIFPDQNNTNVNEKLVLSVFCMQTMNDLLQKVKSFLSDCQDISILPSINTQLMFGMSLSRVGLDIRPLYVEMFESTVVRIVSHYFRMAVEEFEIDYTKHIERAQQGMDQNDILMRSTPVALAYNMYLNGLNQLRYLPCKSAFVLLSNLALETLAEISQKVVAANPTNKRNSEIIAWILSYHFIPSICSNLDSVLQLGKTDPTSILTSLQEMAENGKPNVERSRSSVNNSADNVFVEDDTGAGLLDAANDNKN